jgi:hypothetical protein
MVAYAADIFGFVNRVVKPEKYMSFREATVNASKGP